ncbi:TPA: hypothetical protein ACNUVO_001672 [Aeromonas salmonicida subsp. pectinolytica]|uniref:hypothetical protein n=1 Tax=Aeromonas salmonicida TaxID=645 RepID=UPI00233006DB|nr:hypothetical protein [Aeromonas salmonicida]MCE9935885.1 hypothetical protein [Aeromonas salmonicida]WCH28415.1 hypothetical protein ONZ66_06305 [Aeromonas salmonicida]
MTYKLPVILAGPVIHLHTGRSCQLRDRQDHGLSDMDDQHEYDATVISLLPAYSLSFHG